VGEKGTGEWVYGDHEYVDVEPGVSKEKKTHKQ